MKKYWVLSTPTEKGTALITAYPDGGPDSALYNEGVSLKKKFPDKASVSFSYHYPKDRELRDFQPNTLRALIISPKAQKVINDLKLSNTELLPIAVNDHSGRVVSDEYAFLNLLGSEDAIDLRRSVYRVSPPTPDQIKNITLLQLQPNKIHPDAKMFRCKQKRTLFLVNDEVKEAFEQAGLSGYKLHAAEEWRDAFSFL